MAPDCVNYSRNIMSKVKRALQYLAVLLALLPIALYAWQGQYLRPMIDDYYTLRIGRELGPWNGMLFHYNTWSGGYTNFYIKSAMAPLDTLTPAATTWHLIAMWLIAALWLARALLPWLGIKTPGWQLVFVIAASIVTASIYSQYSSQTFYWHAAAIGYSMPVTILTMFLALLADSSLRSATDRQIFWRASASVLLCFLSAGFSEIFVALQATLLTFGLLFAPAFRRGKARRNFMLLLGPAWLATLAGLLIHSNSPGVALRMEAESMSFAMTAGEYLEWAARAVEFSIQVVGSPRALTGFSLLFCVSLGATLFCSPPRANGSAGKVVCLRRSLFWLGLLSQLLMLPMLWAYRSEDPQVFGRFSREFMVVIAANAILILFFAFACWRWRRIRAALAQSARLVWFCLCTFLAAALILFGLMQLSDIGWQGQSYLYLSTLLLLLLLAGQLTSWLCDTWLRSLFLAAILSTLVAWLLIGAIIFIAFVSVGYMQMRLLALATAAMVFSGLVWGACLGSLMKQWLHERSASKNWISWLGICSAVVALMIGVDIVSGQARIIPRLAGYASEWDDRHRSIIDQRDRGERDIKVQPLNFNMPRFLAQTSDRETHFRYALAYYGVDSISEVES